MWSGVWRSMVRSMARARVAFMRSAPWCAVSLSEAAPLVSERGRGGELEHNSTLGGTMRIGVGLCVGTMVTELLALSGQTLALTGFMGSKRRWARELAATAYGQEKLDRVIAVDAGPWGDVWTVLTDAAQRARVIERLYALDKQGTARELWGELVSEAPSEDPARRVAQYLCVQSRVSNNLPVWWERGETAQLGVTPVEMSTSGGG